MRKRNILIDMRRFMMLAGFMFSVGYSILLYITFLFAFFNGGSILVLVNSFGEMWFEFFLIPVVLFFSVLGLYFFLCDMFKIKRGVYEQ